MERVVGDWRVVMRGAADGVPAVVPEKEWEGVREARVKAVAAESVAKGEVEGGWGEGVGGAGAGAASAATQQRGGHNGSAATCASQ